jgi:hypothetical protein
MNIKNNGQDIASNISHAIESSWRSVFWKPWKLYVKLWLNIKWFWWMTCDQIISHPSGAEKNQTSTGKIAHTSCQGYFELLLMIFS